jgi:hypothetical protein
VQALPGELQAHATGNLIIAHAEATGEPDLFPGPELVVADNANSGRTNGAIALEIGPIH